MFLPIPLRRAMDLNTDKVADKFSILSSSPPGRGCQIGCSTDNGSPAPVEKCPDRRVRFKSNGPFEGFIGFFGKTGP
jgi:hypothetical protein